VVCVPEGEGVVAYLVSWTGGFGRGGALGRSRVERRCAGPGRWEAMLSLYNVLEKEVADALLNRIPWSEGANACGGTDQGLGYVFPLLMIRFGRSLKGQTV
jgi:hypothetical protein